MTSVPAFAQIGVEVGPGGVGVEVGRDRDRDYRRDRVYEDRREYREGDRREYREGVRYERRYRVRRADIAALPSFAAACRTVL